MSPFLVINALLLSGGQMWRRLRLMYWNAHPQIRISAHNYVAHSAQIQMRPDGQHRGGTIEIAAGATISDGVVLAPYGGRIVLGEGVYIGPYSVLYGHGGLEIGKNSMIASHTIIIPSNHRFQDIDRPIRHQGAESRGIMIGEDVWVGAGVRILDGVTIGRGCVIGAGAVVNRALPEFAIAVGVPARVVGWRSDVAGSETSRPSESRPGVSFFSALAGHQEVLPT